VLQRHSYFAILSAAGNSHEVYGATSPKAMGSMCQNYVAREFLTACWENSLFSENLRASAQKPLDDEVPTDAKTR
jgi:hypothetical protein